MTPVFLLILAHAVLPGTAHAVEWKLESSFEQSPEIISGVGTAGDLELSPVIHNEFSGKHETELDGGNLSFGVSLNNKIGLSDSDLNRYGLKTTFEYSTALKGIEDINLRYALTLEHSRTEDEEVFSRIRAGARITRRRSKTTATFIDVRGGYHDHNDDRFVGFDRFELRTIAGFIVRVPEHKIRWSGEIEAERMLADGANFSNTKLGTSLQFQWEFEKKTFLGASIKYHHKEFDSEFSKAIPVIREDNRFQMLATFQKNFNNTTRLKLGAGYESQQSSVSSRAAEGLVFKLGLTRTW